MRSMCQSRHSPEASGGPHARAGGCPKKAVTLYWSRLLVAPMDPRTEESMLEQVWQDLLPKEGTHARAACA